MNYDECYSFIEKILKRNDMPFYYLLDKYCVYIYKNTEEYKGEDYTKLDISESEKIIESFLGDFSQELLDNYLNIRNYDPFHFKDISTLKFEVENVIKELIKQKNDLEDELKHPEKERKEKHYFIEDHIKLIDELINIQNQRLLYKENIVDLEGNVYITSCNNASDIFTIVHEYTHKLFMQKIDDNDMPYVWDILAESPSIAMELILCDYLKQIGYTKDAKNYILNRFNYIRNYALEFHYMMLIIQNYSKFHTINDEIINMAILNEDEVIRNDLLTKNTELNNVYFSFMNMNIIPYIMGLLIGCQLKSKIQDNPYKLMEIGKYLYDDNLEETFSKLGITFFNSIENQNFSLNPEICNTFLDEYHNLHDNKDLNIK